MLEILVYQKYTVSTNITCPLDKYLRIMLRDDIFPRKLTFVSHLLFNKFLYCNIPINPMSSSLISYSSIIQNNMNTSSVKPSKSSDGDVLLTVNQVLLGTFKLLLLGCTLKTSESLDHL